MSGAGLAPKAKGSLFAFGIASASTGRVLRRHAFWQLVYCFGLGVEWLEGGAIRRLSALGC